MTKGEQIVALAMEKVSHRQIRHRRPIEQAGESVQPGSVRQSFLFPAPVLLPEVPVFFPYIYSYQLHRPDSPY